MVGKIHQQFILTLCCCTQQINLHSYVFDYLRHIISIYMMTYNNITTRFISSLATLIIFVGNTATYLVSASSERELEVWRGTDLPWEDLSSKLSADTSLIDTSFEDYKEECFPEFVDYTFLERTNHALIDQPSGLCMPHLYCGWNTCYPRPSDDDHATTTFEMYRQDYMSVVSADLAGGEIPSDFDPSNPNGFLQDPANPSLDLPSKVLFPVVASDVVAAIQFAKEHGLEISVKNSGHSYQGASSKKDTLHLNMNRYTHYAPTGVTDCDASMLESAIAEDLSDQPCHLSVAKGKPAIIKVGGGENFDKVYRAVSDVNKAQEGGYKYHLVGGGAGTVSPMGWTWQGGLGGTTGSRKFGLGVDQVVQIEMVLPNGYHVKFGPTDWEDATAEGFIVPKTTVVSGVCRSNPEEQDEEKWTWETCPDDFDIDFNDLWFAVRGGGGGTWGIVTAVHLQLHDYYPLNHYEFNKDSTEECLALNSLYNEFKSMYFMLPSLLNVTKEKSNACGKPDGGARMFCYGEDDVMQAWSRLLDERNVLTNSSECFISKTTYNDFAENHPRSALAERYPGRTNDVPMPLLPSLLTAAAFILLPQSWIEENWDTYVESYLTEDGGEYDSFGGGAATAYDQTTSLSQAHRDAATTLAIAPDEHFWANIFPDMFDSSDGNNFPPVFGSNHAGPELTGPLKEDWTKMCPEEFTLAETNEKCISFQEAIYGTERLLRLETIKMKVDPKFMFDCNYCILNNRPKEAVQYTEEVGGSGDETGVPLAGPSSSGSLSSVQLFYAMAAFSVYITII